MLKQIATLLKKQRRAVLEGKRMSYVQMGQSFYKGILWESVGRVILYLLLKEKGSPIRVSPLFHYWLSHVLLKARFFTQSKYNKGIAAEMHTMKKGIKNLFRISVPTLTFAAGRSYTTSSC